MKHHSLTYVSQCPPRSCTVPCECSLIIQTSDSKVMSLLFNMLSSFVIAFLLRSNLLKRRKCIKQHNDRNKVPVIPTISSFLPSWEVCRITASGFLTQWHKGSSGLPEDKITKTSLCADVMMLYSHNRERLHGIILPSHTIIKVMPLPAQH